MLTTLRRDAQSIDATGYISAIKAPEQFFGGGTLVKGSIEKFSNELAVQGIDSRTKSARADRSVVYGGYIPYWVGLNKDIPLLYEGRLCLV